MTVDEAKEIAIAVNGMESDSIDRALVLLMLENNRLQELLNDRLPNGGMVSHGAKHSMQPTIKNDTI